MIMYHKYSKFTCYLKWVHRQNRLNGYKCLHVEKLVSGTARENLNMKYGIE